MRFTKIIKITLSIITIVKPLLQHVAYISDAGKISDLLSKL